MTEHESKQGIELCLSQTYQEVKGVIIKAASVLDPFPTTKFYAKRVNLWHGRFRHKDVKSFESYPISELPGIDIDVSAKKHKIFRYLDPKTNAYLAEHEWYVKHFILHHDGLYVYDSVGVGLEGVKANAEYWPSLPTKKEFLEAYPLFYSEALSAICKAARQQRRS